MYREAQLTRRERGPNERGFPTETSEITTIVELRREVVYSPDLLAVAWSDRLGVLEPYEVKVSSTVLRGQGRGNVTLLPDLARHRRRRC